MKIPVGAFIGVSCATFGFGYLQALTDIGRSHPGWLALAAATIFASLVASIE